ncbi:MAG: protease HtpX [delta proteobacterium ML8_D]|jgi:heat shock protein HtpX|nr:MAG: protease HtpX [delta proteobacterium ML8_D]
MYNTFKTFIFLAALTALFLLVGGALGGRTGMTVALLMAGAMNFFAYWYSDKLALKMSGAREVSKAETPQLHSIVEGLAHKAGLPKPRVYIIAQQTPNAFATGRNPDHAAVAVTEGIMHLLNREELEGVLAHEFAHIRNRDILISSIAAVIAGAISYIATMAQWAMLFGGFGGSDDDSGNAGGLLGGLVMMIIAPIAAALIQMAISRSREYQADAVGAEICKNPMSLANALKKLDEWNHRVPMKVNPATAQMYIVNPLTGASLAKLFSTHPPTHERIRRLRSMAGYPEGL